MSNWISLTFTQNIENSVSRNLNFQNFNFRSHFHGNTLFLVTMVTIGSIQKSLTQIMQHINISIGAKFKQIIINQCLQICLQPFILLWVSLITGDYHFVNKFEILH